MADSVNTGEAGDAILTDSVVAADGTTANVQRMKMGFGREGEYADLTTLPATEETALLILYELRKLTFAFGAMFDIDLDAIQ